MAVTEVLLLKHLEKLGSEGQAVKVKAGYARNYLLPRGLAVRMSSANKKQIETLTRVREQREQRELTEANQLFDQLSKVVVVLAVKTGENGKMFGAITPADISRKIAESGMEIDKKKIIAGFIKELGRHSVKIRLHRDVEFDLPVEVVSENPIN
ncbi:MAG: 50S ribosomal protein L9 [Puniceicoccales bacterium]|jgi:large subunit ribosomal protein L9|nr:50S ribosomal protein L9 [Puniceicoccales bacterium]